MAIGGDFFPTAHLHISTKQTNAHLQISTNNEKLGRPLPERKSVVASNETQVMNSNYTSSVLETLVFFYTFLWSPLSPVFNGGSSISQTDAPTLRFGAKKKWDQEGLAPLDPPTVLISGIDVATHHCDDPEQKQIHGDVDDVLCGFGRSRGLIVTMVEQVT